MKIQLKILFYLIPLSVSAFFNLSIQGQVSTNNLDWELDYSGKLDSLYFEEFVITHQNFPDTGGGTWGSQFKIYRNDSLLASSREWPFCVFDIHDINNDGVNDVIFAYGSGGTNALETTEIYSLHSSADKIAYLDGLNLQLGGMAYRDIDGDSINELYVFELSYRNYYFYPAGPLVYLVWKWDPQNRFYKLANFKLGKQILNEFYQINIDTFNLDDFLAKASKVDRYFPGNDEAYPLEPFSLMLEFIYSGYPAIADSILNRLWPDSVAGKDLFYNDAKGKMESTPCWYELQHSKW